MKDKLLKIIDLELRARGVKGRGLYLPEGHARAIWEGNKSLILKDRNFNIDNEKLLIFGLHYAYGYVWLDKPFVIKSKKEFDKLQKEHRVTDEQFKRWGWEFPLYAYRIKKKELFKNPSPIKLPRGVQNILINPERYMDISFEKADIRAKAQKLTPEEYKQLIKEGDYKNKPLPSKYYVDYREGYALAQFHIRGVKPEDRDAFIKHKKSFKEIIIGHSLHCDIRWHLKGIDKLIQGILVESDMESYIRVLLGELNKEQKGHANVQKGLFLSKERMQIEEPSNMRIKKTKEYLIDEKGAEIIDKYIIKDKSYWLFPGDVGATIHAFGYLGAIWTGKVKTGTARPDYHELFFYSDTDQPELNQKLLNGRFIIKAFKRPQGSPLYWIWKATADPEPENPYCHLDMGYHPIMLETKIKYFKKEDYPEWDKRKEICT